MRTDMVWNSGVDCRSPQLVESRVVEVTDQGITDDRIADAGQLENAEKLVLDVNAKRGSFLFAFNDTRKQFFSITVIKTALASCDQVGHRDSMVAPKACKAMKALRRASCCSGQQKRRRGSQTPSTVDMNYMIIFPHFHSLPARFTHETTKLSPFDGQNTRQNWNSRCSIVQDSGVIFSCKSMIAPHPQDSLSDQVRYYTQSLEKKRILLRRWSGKIYLRRDGRIWSKLAVRWTWAPKHCRRIRKSALESVMPFITTWAHVNDARGTNYSRLFVTSHSCHCSSIFQRWKWRPRKARSKRWSQRIEKAGLWGWHTLALEINAVEHTCKDCKEGEGNLDSLKVLRDNLSLFSCGHPVVPSSNHKIRSGTLKNVSTTIEFEQKGQSFPF